MGQGESATIIPPEIMADPERAIEILMTGQRDPEFEGRTHAQAEKISQEVLERHGVLDIGVPAIRALRDGDEWSTSWTPRSLSSGSWSKPSRTWLGCSATSTAEGSTSRSPPTSSRSRSRTPRPGRTPGTDLSSRGFHPAGRGVPHLSAVAPLSAAAIAAVRISEEEPGEESPLGLILCAGKSEKHVE